jgi:cation diffusion facilitator family transporter
MVTPSTLLRRMVMSEECCSQAEEALERIGKRQSSTLKVVLGINVLMFLVEVVAGWFAGSTALLADSLDMLGDAFAYGFSLYVVRRSARWKAVSAMFKGGIMAAFGLFVLGQAVYKMVVPQTPHFVAIGIIGLLALVANSACLGLLWRHRAEDINMRSVWLCSRNDILANLCVIVAAAGVWLADSQWPDVLIGLGIALVFLRSATRVLREAVHTYNRFPG